MLLNPDLLPSAKSFDIVSLEDGYITDSSIEESAIKKAMLINSSKAYYLCDTSKKNKKYMYNKDKIDIDIKIHRQ